MSEHIGRSESLRLSISGGLAAMLPQADSSCADLANSSLARLPSCVVGREWSRFQLSRAVVMPGQLRHILRLWIQPHTSCYARPQSCAQLRVGRILHSCFRRVLRNFAYTTFMYIRDSAKDQEARSHASGVASAVACSGVPNNPRLTASLLFCTDSTTIISIRALS